MDAAFDYQMRREGYSTMWVMVPTDAGVYDIGDTATVVSFSSLTSSGSNVVQDIVMTADDTAFNFVVSTAAIAAALAAAL